MEEKLFNKNYLCLCAANFLFFFSFYLLLPVLPFFFFDQSCTSMSEAYTNMMMESSSQKR